MTQQEFDGAVAELLESSLAMTPAAEFAEATAKRLSHDKEEADRPARVAMFVGHSIDAAGVKVDWRTMDVTYVHDYAEIDTYLGDRASDAQRRTLRAMLDDDRAALSAALVS